MARTQNNLSFIPILASTTVLIVLLLASFTTATSTGSYALSFRDSVRLTDGSKLLRDLRPERSTGNTASKRSSSLSGLTSLNELNLAAREGPADELAMVMAVESTLSLLQAQATSVLEASSQAVTPTTSSSSIFPTAPLSMVFQDPGIPLPTDSLSPQPSESAVINYLLPMPGDEAHGILPGITSTDIAAVSVVAVIVVVILVAFCIPRKKGKQPPTQAQETARSGYIVEPPEYSRYPLDLEKGSTYEWEGEEEKTREYMSTFRFPPVPAPAHITDRDIAPSYSSQSF
jgi:hypothetical protein